jgi:carbonic anhydrase
VDKLRYSYHEQPALGHRNKMSSLDQLIENNRQWVERMRESDPDFFSSLSQQQTPEILWIGCSDSRVPANQITGLLPGEIFVHRNVANLVVHTDLNCLSVLQFAVDCLKVKHVIVCGHYGCGGVHAALTRQQLGLVDNWLRHVIDIHEKHQTAIDALENVELRSRRLCELNVVEQAFNVCQSSVVQDAWKRGQELTVHGWIYDVADGLLNSLRFAATSINDFNTTYRAAVTGL